MKNLILSRAELDITEMHNREKIISLSSTEVYEKMLTFREIVSIEKITYMANNLAVSAYVIQPREPGNYPCVIDCRGGFESFGEVTHMFLYNNTPTYTAKHGYVVICPQYPGVDGGEGYDGWGAEDDLASIENLVPVFSEIPNADTKNIFLCGGSRGATMITMLLRRKKHPYAAAVLKSGSYDQKSLSEFRPEMVKNVFIPAFNNTPEGIIDRSAVYWADEMMDMPVLILHGQHDERVPVSSALELYKQISHKKSPSKLIIYPGDDHFISVHRPQWLEEMINWFKKHTI